jgi:hypothetical protein
MYLYYIMSITTTTLITHIFNEEYLLPFWLHNHKDMFDELFVIDYNSTDKSIEICKNIWPGCKIITTRNKYFGAKDIDAEVMDIENGIKGIKMVLNTTEFLFCEIPIKDIFKDDTNPKSYQVNMVTPYSIKNYNVNNNFELIRNLLNADVVYHHDRGVRQLHNFSNGNYGTGRHSTYNKSILINKAHIVWFGYYPMNDNLLKRKLQIQQNIPQCDKDLGFGFHHLYHKAQMLAINNEKGKSGSSLKNINLSLYNLISNISANVYYPELLNNNNWGENYIMLDNDINLLKNNDGYIIIDIDNYNVLLHRFMQNEIKIITGKDINLQNYHDMITSEEHSKILNSMPYKKNMYPNISEFSVYLETYISSILNEPVKIFNDDIWVRICRPSSISDNDFNPCHKDVYLDFYRNTINIYLPIVGSNEKSSLKIQPGSHKWSESDTIVTKGGAYIKGKQYSVDAIIASKTLLNMIRPNPSESQLMLFSPYLIHGCSDNGNENMTRMSLEIRFIRNDKNKVEQEYKYQKFVKNRNWR